MIDGNADIFQQHSPRCRTVALECSVGIASIGIERLNNDRWNNECGNSDTEPDISPHCEMADMG